MKINPGELCVGSRLEYDVYRGKALLVKRGTLITEALINTLTKLGVKVEVSDSSVPVQLCNLTQSLCNSIIKLDIDNVVDYAETLVDNLIDGEYNGMLHLVYDYDSCTYTHSKNVTLLALLASMEMQYDIKDLQTIAVGALLHDIGKLQVPLSILDKPGKLTKEEFAVIKKHPQIGYTLLDDNKCLSSAVKQIVLQHHENYDGTGYPRMLDVNNGYRHARLIHICDVYEAMCAKRPYKLPMPRQQVRDFIKDKSGTMFDPALVQKFLDAVPAYLVGEELDVCGVSCVVTHSYVGNDPLVQFGEETLKLSTLKRRLGVSA